MPEEMLIEHLDEVGVANIARVLQHSLPIAEIDLKSSRALLGSPQKLMRLG
jgi:hypothetical protein